MQKVTFALNAARRFRYTLDFKKLEEQQRLKKDPASRLRAGTHVIRVRGDLYLFIAYLVGIYISSFEQVLFIWYVL